MGEAADFPESGDEDEEELREDDEDEEDEEEGEAPRSFTLPGLLLVTPCVLPAAEAAVDPPLAGGTGGLSPAFPLFGAAAEGPFGAPTPFCSC